MSLRSAGTSTRGETIRARSPGFGDVPASPESGPRIVGRSKDNEDYRGRPQRPNDQGRSGPRAVPTHVGGVVQCRGRGGAEVAGLRKPSNCEQNNTEYEQRDCAKPPALHSEISIPASRQSPSGGESPDSGTQLPLPHRPVRPGEEEEQRECEYRDACTRKADRHIPVCSGGL